MPTGKIHLYGPSVDTGSLPVNTTVNVFGYRASSQSFPSRPYYEDGTRLDAGQMNLIDVITDARNDPVGGAPLVNPDNFFASTQANVTTTGNDSGLIFDEGVKNGYIKAGGSGVVVVWGFDVAGVWPAGTQLRIKLVGAANNAYAPAPNALTLWCNGVTGSWDAEGNTGTLGFNDVITVDSNGEIWFRLYGQTASDYIVYNGMVIEEIAQPPAFNGTISNISSARVVPLSVDFSTYFSNADSYSITNAPSGSTFNTATGVLTWATPTIGTTSSVKITGTNGDGSTDSNTFDITITAQAPVLSTNFVTLFGNVDLAITAYDCNDNFDYATSWSASGLPAGLSIDSGTGIITGTPTTQGTATPTITATNADGSTNSNAFDWVIGAALPIPTITDVNSGNGIQRTQSIVITGTNFFSAQDTGGVTYNGNTLTVTAWSDTSITVTAPSEGYVFGSSYDLVVTNDGGYSKTSSVAFTPENGYSYITFNVNYAQLPINSFAYNEASLSAIVAGDQAVFQTAASPVGTVTMDNLGVVNITGASSGGNYTFNYYINDVSDLTVSANGTALVTLTSSDADVTAPSWVTAPNASNVTETGFSVAATIGEVGSIYFVIVPGSESTPTPAQVKAGQNSSGGAPIDSGSVIANTALSDTVAGLTAGTAYKACFVAEDDEATPNLQAGVTVVNVTTTAITDTIPPTFATGPSISAINQTTAAASATINEAGTIYMIVLEPFQPAPTSAQVISGEVYQLDSNGQIIDDQQPIIPVFVGSGSSLVNLSVTGVAAGTAYVAYFTARDTANNAQVAPTEINFTTSQPNTVRSLTETLKDEAGNIVANQLLDWQLQDTFGSITDSGQTTTDGSGVFSVTNLTTSPLGAYLIVKDTNDENVMGAYPVQVTEA
jgi:hypothetical protein